MRFFVAAAVIAATETPIVAASSQEKMETGIREGNSEGVSDSRGNSKPSGRGYRKQWTMPRGPTKDVEGLSLSNDSSMSVLLANQTTAYELGFENASYSNNARDIDTDLGIFSSSRRLRPISDNNSTTGEEEDIYVTIERPGSSLFDSFNVIDRDRTSFYSICDHTRDNEYLCFRCDKYAEDKTVADFDCQKISCYEIDSRCANNRMVVCRYDTMERFFDEEPSGNITSVPYTAKKCRKIETRLTKRNRSMGRHEEREWDFSYCLSYNIADVEAFDDDNNGNSSEENDSATPKNTCEMEIDGITCSSCFLETVDVVDTSSSDGASKKEFCTNFDCGNTLLGYSGRFCSNANLASNSIDYFVYRSLPCDAGCNLCGDRSMDDPEAMMMMKYRDAEFPATFVDTSNTTESTEFLFSPYAGSCFEAQWQALMGYQETFLCDVLGTLIPESCGCTPFGGISSQATVAPTNSTSFSSALVEGDEYESASGGTPAMKMSGQQFLLTLAVASLIGFGLV